MAMRGKESDNGLYEFPYMKPPERSGWETFRMAMYDSKNGTVLGRNGKSWVQILIFYGIYYIVLGALFSICMQAMLSTIDDKLPKWQQDNGLIGNNPGLGFRPMSNRTEEGSLIWYNTKNMTSIQKWLDLTEDFLEPYLDKNEGGNQVACSIDKTPGPGHVCDVDLSTFHNCSPANHYGYIGGSPCVFLKLNRIIGWQPQYYNDPDNLPEEMPEELKNRIKETSLKKGNLNQIWVSCRGEFPADKEHVSQFLFYPTSGFQSFYYPYTNEKGYLSPLVAVQILNPTANVLINIECRAWAKNINYRGGNLQREGSIHFEIMKDN